MARAPVPGKTKRRLIPAIGAERAAALHRAMIHRAVTSALASGVGPVELWCTPTMDHEVFRSLQDRVQVELHTQVGADLGTRMHAAIEARPGATAVIGTDCPFLEPGDLVRTAGVLHCSGADVVIVPAFDGGYVLIGVDRPRPELFAGVDWERDACSLRPANVRTRPGFDCWSWNRAGTSIARRISKRSTAC